MPDQKKKGRMFFIYAPPLKGTRPSRRAPPKPAFKGAKSWQNSVYYFWWEYLRRHEGYVETCRAKGRGRYSALYSDFGDVTQPDFWRWWTEHAHFFAEPPPPHVQFVVLNDAYTPKPESVVMEIPLNQRLSLSIRQLKRMIGDRVQVSSRSKSASRALYPVYTKPVLSSLYQALRVWDLKKDHPTWPNYLIKDVADGHLKEAQAETFVSTKDRKVRMSLAGTSAERIQKTLAVSRLLRIAQQYIDNVALGEFPKRTRR